MGWSAGVLKAVVGRPEIGIIDLRQFGRMPERWSQGCNAG
jgi:hypothetical protein